MAKQYRRTVSRPAHVLPRFTDTSGVATPPAPTMTDSAPAEAASDATDVPHDATTPDKPVEEIDVSKK